VVNSAPVLDNTGSPTLDPISINAESETNIGTLVSDLLARMEPLGGVTDSDPGASLGIAINGLTGATNGTWEFTVNGGTNWTPVGTTGNGDARLLAADGNTRVRFVPNAGFVGEAKFSFVVWDRTAGANGGTASVNNRGGATPFSLAYEYASIRVVNNAPVLTVSATSSLDAIPVDVPDVSNPGTSISDLIARMGPSGGITDADPGALSGIRQCRRNVRKPPPRAAEIAKRFQQNIDWHGACLAGRARLSARDEANGWRKRWLL